MDHDALIMLKGQRLEALQKAAAHTAEALCVLNNTAAHFLAAEEAVFQARLDTVRRHLTCAGDELAIKEMPNGAGGGD